MRRRSITLTPRNPRFTAPCSMSCVTTFSAIAMGMASPMPANCPLPTELPRPVAMAVFMPITLPCVSVSGPPELPGLMAASTWMKLSYSTSARPALRPTPETMPLDMLKRNSNGEPNAKTMSPCAGSAEERRAGSNPSVFTRSTAISVRGSSPTSVAGCSDPSWSCTSSAVAPSTTCALVTTCPAVSQIQPEPDCVNCRTPSRPFDSPATLTCTTAGSTASPMSRMAALMASSTLVPAKRVEAASMLRAVRSTCAMRMRAGTVQSAVAAAASSNAAGSARASRDSLMRRARPAAAGGPVRPGQWCTGARPAHRRARDRARAWRRARSRCPPRQAASRRPAASA